MADKFKYVLIYAMLFAGMVVGICSCGSGKVNQGSDSMRCVVADSFDSLFSELFPNEDEPGAIVVVMRGDSIVYNRAFGLANMASEDAINDSTLFNLSSASKIFTAAALLKLCEQGEITLDDSLAMYFPEFTGEFFKHITIRHILTHSSGLPDVRPRNGDEWDKYLSNHKSIFVHEKDYTLYGKEDEHMLVFQNLESAEYDAGAHYNRQDPAYILVAPLIERVTGQGFDQWMETNIFSPSGMKEAFYYTPGFKMPKAAHGYRRVEQGNKALSFRSEDGKWEEYDFGEAPFFLTKADRGVYASARDFMQWNRALYSGKIISDSLLSMMYMPYIQTDIPMVGFGLGTAVKTEPGFPPKAYHLNANGGFAIVEGSWPSKRLHYIVFSNRNDWDRRAVNNSIDSIFKVKGCLE